MRYVGFPTQSTSPSPSAATFIRCLRPPIPDLVQDWVGEQAKKSASLWPLKKYLLLGSSDGCPAALGQTESSTSRFTRCLSNKRVKFLSYVECTSDGLCEPRERDWCNSIAASAQSHERLVVNPVILLCDSEVTLKFLDEDLVEGYDADNLDRRWL